MKILVTGSSGMIGKEVCRLLLEKKIEVIEYSLQKEKDILNLEQLKKDLKGCQAVVHLAAIINEEKSESQIRRVNVDGTKNVLDASAQNRVSRVLFASSVGVYGDTNGTKTEDTPVSPGTPYEKSKSDAEKTVVDYQELVPYTIIRSALVIGPNPYWKQVFQIVSKNFPLIGNGKNHWQTVYYKDLASAIVFLLFLDAAENETFLVAGEEKPTLLELVKTIKMQVGQAPEVKTVPTGVGILLGFFYGLIQKLQGKPNLFSPAYIKRLQRDRDYDLTKIHAYGWKAKYTYAQALKETYFELQKPRVEKK